MSIKATTCIQAELYKKWNGHAIGTLTPLMPGRFKNVPMTGIRRKKFTAAGMKPLQVCRTISKLRGVGESVFLDAPKEQHEAVRLDDHADDWPAEEHDEHAEEECDRAFQLVLLKEEPKCPLEANDERKTGEK